MTLAALGGILILTMVVGLVLPQYQALERAREKYGVTQKALKQQEILFPLYQRAEELAQKPFEAKLPIPEHRTLDRKKISELATVFQDMAKRHHLTLSENFMDISSYKEKAQFISMELQFKGRLFNFRDCLVDLIGLYYVEQIEKITIQPLNGDIKTFTTKLLIYISTRHG